ncbi:MAG: S26 family signal peptidase [Chloroflexaceae bacterium]|nr:S26 family signal peptidase [Chloroflexaceae bacterium]
METRSETISHSDKPGLTSNGNQRLAHRVVRRMLASGRQLRLQVDGPSMLPLITPGRSVWVEQIEPSTLLRRGDIIAMQQGEQIIIHRVIGVHGTRWLTRGDDRWSTDPPVSADAVLGRVVSIEQANGERLMMLHPHWRLMNWGLGWLNWCEHQAPVALFAWFPRLLKRGLLQGMLWPYQQERREA